MPAPVRTRSGSLESVALTDDSAINADVFVFACGPWLGAMFPEVIGDRIRPTRQEIYYFGTPAGDRRFDDDRMPVWIEVGSRLMYGIPGNANRGFKVADDTPGPTFDPTHGSRELTPSGIESVRAFIARRFPALNNAPLLGGEVCQYRGVSRFAFHHRQASGLGERLAGRRRIGPRVQDGTGGWRDRRLGGAGRLCAGWRVQNGALLPRQWRIGAG